MSGGQTELAWKVGLPLAGTCLLLLLPVHGTMTAAMCWFAAIYCAVTAKFVPALWFGSQGLADATYFIVAIAGTIYAARAFLSEFQLLPS